MEFINGLKTAVSFGVPWEILNDIYKEQISMHRQSKVLERHSQASSFEGEKGNIKTGDSYEFHEVIFMVTQIITQLSSQTEMLEKGQHLYQQSIQQALEKIDNKQVSSQKQFQTKIEEVLLIVENYHNSQEELYKQICNKLDAYKISEKQLLEKMGKMSENAETILSDKVDKVALKLESTRKELQKKTDKISSQLERTLKEQQENDKISLKLESTLTDLQKKTDIMSIKLDFRLKELQEKTDKITSEHQQLEQTNIEKQLGLHENSDTISLENYNSEESLHQDTDQLTLEHIHFEKIPLEKSDNMLSREEYLYNELGNSSKNNKNLQILSKPQELNQIISDSDHQLYCEIREHLSQESNVGGKQMLQKDENVSDLQLKVRENVPFIETGNEQTESCNKSKQIAMEATPSQIIKPTGDFSELKITENLTSRSPETEITSYVERMVISFNEKQENCQLGDSSSVPLLHTICFESVVKNVDDMFTRCVDDMFTRRFSIVYHDYKLQFVADFYTHSIEMYVRSHYTQATSSLSWPLMLNVSLALADKKSQRQTPVRYSSVTKEICLNRPPLNSVSDTISVYYFKRDIVNKFIFENNLHFRVILSTAKQEIKKCKRSNKRRL